MFDVNTLISPDAAKLLRDNGFPQAGWRFHWALTGDGTEFQLIESVPRKHNYKAVFSAPSRDELFEFISLYGNGTHMKQLLTGYAITAQIVFLTQIETAKNVEKD